MSRIKRAVQRFGAVDALHADEISSTDIKNKLVPKIKSNDGTSSTTMLLLCSPQILATNRNLRHALIAASKRKVLRLVAIDETHLYGMHGCAFRESIRILKRVFFAVLFNERARFHPQCLLVTATMMPSQLQSISDLTTIDWTKKHHQQWSSPSEFRQRYIEMDLKVTGDIGQKAFPAVVERLQTDENAYVCIFVNFCSETRK